MMNFLGKFSYPQLCVPGYVPGVSRHHGHPLSDGVVVWWCCSVIVWYVSNDLLQSAMTRPWRQLKQAVKVKIKKTFHLIPILWEILPNNIRFFSLTVREQLKYSDLLVLLCRLPRRVYYLCSQHDTSSAALQSLRRELYRNISHNMELAEPHSSVPGW